MSVADKKVDGRTWEAKRRTQIITRLRKEMGREPSIAEQILLDQVATIIILDDRAKKLIMEGDDKAGEKATTRARTLLALFKRLGLEDASGSVPVRKDLDDYVEFEEDED